MRRRFAARSGPIVLGILSVALAPFVGLVRAVAAVGRDPQTRGLLAGAALLLLSGMLLFHWIEGWRLFDALYFTLVTLATVGYGDFHPRTDAGKALTIVYIVGGISILLGLLDAIAGQRIGIAQRRRARFRSSHGVHDTDSRDDIGPSAG
jgi:voltage-gated potassium channel